MQTRQGTTLTRAARAPIALAAAVALVGGVGVRSEPSLPRPGSPAAVASLVAASPQIQRLPGNLVPSLYDVVNDDTSSYYPHTGAGCAGTTRCVFGDRRATATIVLFGDSHAYMWLPAIVPFATAARMRLVLVWRPGCPAADVTVFDGAANRADVACNAFRTKSIAEIRALDPRLVLLASRTTQIEGATGGVVSEAAWELGLERTIRALRSVTTKLAVIGDVTEFSTILPDCLAANPSQVQQCSSPDPNTKEPDHFAAERAAAKAMRVPYVNPHPWLCRSVCSPVVGEFATYYNNNHIAATYAAYLSGVFGAVLRSILR